jgi:hypothetical protein
MPSTKGNKSLRKEHHLYPGKYSGDGCAEVSKKETLPGPRGVGFEYVPRSGDIKAEHAIQAQKALFPSCTSLEGLQVQSLWKQMSEVPSHEAWLWKK